ncbi:alpha-L-arabinofuranosidase protein-like protein [Corynespora cassiicola Philippines]|uniref:non-reducing end alpha-L-arabinofuranosidase n=1 Tax=Corynespora cassiicola Philippines TaxID=1448308 RepID=A0A2T2NH24_CORCC|nr:alpha-L-arabinofuranosidase protein-like protein [Corynespora cassiicola Philippines]
MTSYVHAKNASISVFPHHRLNPINRNIYSGFIEHMGRCVYGGIYDPQNPNQHLLTSAGFRKDVIDALKPLNIPVFRYPGGNFCATYHWLDGVGPRERRPKRPDLAWGAVEGNTFGTDEFMQWCKELDAEPYLCLNFGTGTLDEALGWVEYCNSSQDTYYANLRRENGRSEPYKVKYWALGNEMWGDWQVEQMTDIAYAEKALQWAKALKYLDPDIQLILCGREGPTSWDYTVLKHCLRARGNDPVGQPRIQLIDMHSIHLYTASEDHYENVYAPLTAERAIEVAGSLIDLAYYEHKIPAVQKRPKICFDEWNVWWSKRAPGWLGAEEMYTLSDALAVAVWLNVFVRKSNDVDMANIAQSVNVISPLMTTKTGIIKQTSWYPYELFCRYMSGALIAVHVACDYYEGPTKSEFTRITKETPWLDVSATWDKEHVNLAVVNMHRERDMDADIIGVKNLVQMYEVNGVDVNVTNMAGTEEVSIKESTWSGQGKYLFPKHSFTLLRWKC